MVNVNDIIIAFVTTASSELIKFFMKFWLKPHKKKVKKSIREIKRPSKIHKTK